MVNFYWELPLLGIVVSPSTVSFFLLYFIMVGGMFCKAIYDRTLEEKVLPRVHNIFRPLMVSPIAYSAFWGSIYIQQGGTGPNFTMMLFAFQIGFFWQHVLDKQMTALSKHNEAPKQ